MLFRRHQSVVLKKSIQCRDENERSEVAVFTGNTFSRVVHFTQHGLVNIACIHSVGYCSTISNPVTGKSLAFATNPSQVQDQKSLLALHYQP